MQPAPPLQSFPRSLLLSQRLYLADLNLLFKEMRTDKSVDFDDQNGSFPGLLRRAL